MAVTAGTGRAVACKHTTTTHPEQYAAMGPGSVTGVLLYGPPGCDKTCVAKATANKSGVNLISIIAIVTCY